MLSHDVSVCAVEIGRTAPVGELNKQSLLYDSDYEAVRLPDS